MAEKILKTRIIQKHDTEENWIKYADFVPYQGEIIVYDKDKDHSYERVKIGDGTSTVTNLAFITDDIALQLLNKVDKIEGKGLSTNDYTTEEKNKLANIPSDATNNKGTITGVTAGAGLVGNATSGVATLAVGQGRGIVVSDDSIAVNTTYETNGKNYQIEIDDETGGLYVNVPWENSDTVYTHPEGTAANLEKKLYKISTDANSHIASVSEVTKNDIVSLGIPAENTDTTYSAGTGITIDSDNKINHTNSITAGIASEGGIARTLAFGDSFNIPYITYDAQGHITAKDSTELKLPSNPDTGATGVEYSGEGNALTGVSYDANSRKLTFTRANYNNYTLPNAGTALGGVKTGGVATITEGVITAISKTSDADHADSADKATVADKVENALKIQGNGTGISFDGSAEKTVNLVGSGTVSVSGDTSGTITITGSAHPTALKNPNALSISVNGTSTVYDGSSAESITIDAASLGLTGAMKFGGVVSSLPATSTAGTVVLMGNKEYVYNDSNTWVELGDESSHALKTVEIKAGSGLTGGGTLEASRTISHGDTSSVSNLTANGRNYVTGLTFDDFGHVTGVTTGTETVTAYTLPTAKYNTLGGVKPAYSSTGAAVLTTSAATNATTPTIAAKTTEAGRYYGVETDKNGVLYVNVPWTDNNTEYTAGTGINIANGAINHANSITAATAQGSATGTLSFGGTFTIPTVTYDAQGHITGKGTTTMTMPANPHISSNLITGASASATSNASVSNGNVYLNLVENNTVRNSHLITGSGTVSVSSDTDGKIVITGSEHPAVRDSKITISAGDGLTGSGEFTLNQSSAKTITIGHSNSVTAGTVAGGSGQLSYSGTFTVPSITYDAQGHITGTTTTTYTLPADSNVDTKVTQTPRTTNGNFPILLRGTSEGTTTTTTTTSFASAVTVNPSSGLITATRFVGNLNVNYLDQTEEDELILNCN